MEEKVDFYRDQRGRTINTGDIVIYGKRKGIIREEDREGQYIELKDGFKLRLESFHRKVRVVGATKRNKNKATTQRSSSLTHHKAATK